MSRVALDLEADIQPVSDFRANASAMLQQVRDTGRPLVLTQRGRGAAVLLDIRSYQGLLDELEELRDVAQGLADVAEGRVVAHEDVAARVAARLTR
ncbi:MAG: type II toxin-antitoxin system Phd/YefM family antitoxin [Myxococcota bacterium]